MPTEENIIPPNMEEALNEAERELIETFYTPLESSDDSPYLGAIRPISSSYNFTHSWGEALDTPEEEEEDVVYACGISHSELDDCVSIIWGELNESQLNDVYVIENIYPALKFYDCPVYNARNGDFIDWVVDRAYTIRRSVRALTPNMNRSESRKYIWMEDCPLISQFLEEDNYRAAFVDFVQEHSATPNKELSKAMKTLEGKTVQVVQEDRTVKEADAVYAILHYAELDGKWYASPKAAVLHGYVIYPEEKNNNLCAFKSYPYELSYNDCVYRYHEGPRDFSALSDETNSGIFLGIEIEKEDVDVRQSDSRETVLHRTNWTMERDGSLDDGSGFELVSPVFDLMEHDFHSEFRKIRRYVNADYSSRCGGHFTVSKRGMSGYDIFNRISTSWIPFLYCLFPNRAHKRHCEYKLVEHTCANDHYQSVAIRDATLEFRMFSAISDDIQLLWRVKLLQYIMSNMDKTPVSILSDMMRKDSELYKLLRRRYSDERIKEKVSLFCILFTAYAPHKTTLQSERKVMQHLAKSSSVFKGKLNSHSKRHIMKSLGMGGEYSKELVKHFK